MSSENHPDLYTVPNSLAELRSLAEYVSNRYDLFVLGQPAQHKDWPDGREVHCGDYSYGVGYIPADFVLHAFESVPPDEIARLKADISQLVCQARRTEGTKGHGKYYTKGYLDALEAVKHLIDNPPEN